MACYLHFLSMKSTVSFALLSFRLDIEENFPALIEAKEELATRFEELAETFRGISILVFSFFFRSSFFDSVLWPCFQCFIVR